VTPDAPVTVITGGGGGMGLATARLLGADHAVVISDLSADRLAHGAQQLRQQNITCHTIECDVTVPAAVADLAARSRSLGLIASAVHTAGVSPQMADPERIVRINALGTVNVNRAFSEDARDGFRMVNVASSAGHLGAGLPAPVRSYPLAHTDPDRFVQRMVRRTKLVPKRLRSGIAYALSKNFVIWQSRNLAGSLGRAGASIVSVSPGSFDTEMGLLESDSGSGEVARRSALGRFGRVEEIAELLAFLAGPGPGYLTGTDILVDGGAKATMGFRDLIATARQAQGRMPWRWTISRPEERGPRR
jgi:NAD(P)-dependent dehydrogenase (short-subunit alcohol dehydrogenase family)